MGAWGQGIFDNDSADDWAALLVSEDNLQPIYEAFSTLKRAGNNYPDTYECYEALAAAEIVAAMRGYPGDTLPDELKIWSVQHSTQASTDLVKEAMTIVVRIFRNSELRDNREDPGGRVDYVPMEWYRIIGDLMSRLK